MDCIGRAAHTRSAALNVVMMKNAAGGKWKAINCQECSLWHVERCDGEQKETL